MSVTEYAEKLETSGLLELGEPLVYYKIEGSFEKLECYLDYTQHSVHIPLLSTNFISSGKEGLYSIFNSKTEYNKPLALSDFVKEHKHRRVKDFDISEFQNARLEVSSQSKKKQLTWLLGKRILDLDKVANSRIKQERINKLTELIKFSFDSIGRPEQAAYLSRFDDLTLGEKDAFVSLPIDWMTSMFRYESNNHSITLPWLSSEAQPPANKPHSRRRVLFTA